MAQPEHHVLFNRRQWQSSCELKKARNNDWLRVPLDSMAHTALHKAVSFVPVVDHRMISAANHQFEPVEGDYLATIDAFILALDAARQHPNTLPLDRTIAGLTMDAIAMQLPYVRDGLVL